VSGCLRNCRPDNPVYALIAIGFDSITFIKTIVALENEFDFEFDDDKLLFTEFPTIKSMVEYVESKVEL